MKCEYCSYKLDEGIKSCPMCGAPSTNDVVHEANEVKAISPEELAILEEKARVKRKNYLFCIHNIQWAQNIIK